MALQKYVPSNDSPSGNLKSLSLSRKATEKVHSTDADRSCTEADVDIDLSEVYFLIMHFLSAGPCHRTYGQFWNELLEHHLLPRRYHVWYSRSGMKSGDENDDDSSFPLSYNKLVERYPHVQKDHLVKLLKQLLLGAAAPSQSPIGRNPFNAAAVPTLLGTGSFSLLGDGIEKENSQVKHPPGFMRWPHMQADQVRGLSLREIGGGFSRHHRAPSVRAACYAIVKPSTMVQKMQHVKRLRGHRNAVYCAIFDRLGRYVITGSDDRLVKIWSMETAYCLASCRGHEGDITDLAVSFNNALVASASNDCIIRVWRLADGLPISVLRGHTGAVTAITFSPRPGSVYHLLSSSDDGTCRIWDARYSQFSPRIYVPKPPDSLAGKSNGPSSSTVQQSRQIFCCAFNASGSVFVTGSSDTHARVWNACKLNSENSDQPNHEMDILAGHENDVNYVQFSGCAVASRFSPSDASKEENLPKFKNTWFTHDNIVTCSRDGSAIIWIPRSRRSHGKAGRWTRAYHLKVPPPPMPPQPSRGGPRQRILPTPRGVNMIVWSLDNRFVLAAIMDCRICVWNAVDGSLLHSLTGHSESTYVLDVHPFNPRIAMSAGYDGKTIVWDICEGIPIQVYEIGRFKLVDGKFSPDGTSIILSDDVGQLYILSTGQGESQKDARYDQFFLGDYRPLIQDAHGNFIDQETQLIPYRRNMQDLLCDSAMIPYPEPYQSMYQKRRLGALGLEWWPSSLRFAVGTDINLDREYQIPPILDLDVLIDPLPEILDVMDWEPEIDVQSDDNDSEYNVTEEYHSGGEQGSLSSNSFGSLECSAEDSEDQKSHDDSIRRSKRKKLKAEVEITTSSGRRVKRRNLDGEDNSSRIQRRKKSRFGRKAFKKKSSPSKAMRPQRAAARNALNLFSRITGRSTDGEDEDLLEGELSGEDSNIESDESEASFENESNEHSRGKEVCLDVVTLCDGPELRPHTGTRRLVFKLPNRDPRKQSTSENMTVDVRQPDIVGSSSSAPQGTDEISKSYPQDIGLSLDDGDGEKFEGKENGELVRIDSYASILEGYKDGKIRWGGVKSRSSKRSKMVDQFPSSVNAGSVSSQVKNEGVDNGHPTFEANGFAISPSPEIKYQDGTINEMVPSNHHFIVSEDWSNNVEHSGFAERGNYDESVINQGVNEKATTSAPCDDLYDNLSKLKEKPMLLPTKLRIKSRVLSRDEENPNKLRTSVRGPEDAALSGGPSEVPDHDNTKRESLDGGLSRWAVVETLIDRNLSSDLQDTQKLHPRDKMFKTVYTRSKSFRNRSNLGNDVACMEASTSNSIKNNQDEWTDASDHGTRKTRYMGLGPTSHDVIPEPSNATLPVGNNDSEDTSTSVERSSIDGGDELPHEGWRPSSRVTVGLRSTRSRRSTDYTREITPPPERRKSHQSARSSSWLMLSTHEEGSRYIPQLGDEVVYFRQGHQDYIDRSKSRETVPWKTIKGDIGAVEFCRVKDLEYSFRPGSGESCCKMTLHFDDPYSSVVGKSFKLTLPELTDFPDFLVERSRYDAAMERNWRYRDKCQVWWNDGKETGDWWDGRITAVKPKSIDFPDSPWERYSVQYKTEPAVYEHSPWELYDSDMELEQPHIEDEVRSMLLHALAKLERSGNKAQDSYGIKKLKQVSNKSTFTNRFPVPLSLEVIQFRLENNYYRRLGAMRHDIQVMLTNAEIYFEKNKDLLPKIQRLSCWFTHTLSAL